MLVTNTGANDTEAKTVALKLGKQYAEHSKKHDILHIWSSNCTPEHSSKGNNSISPNGI